MTREMSGGGHELTRTFRVWPTGLLLAATLVFLSAVGAKAQTLSFSGIDGSQNHEAVSRVLRAAYAELGYELDITTAPARRSIEMVNAGQFDGEVQRITAVGDSFENIQRVPVPILETRWKAYTLDPDLKATKWSDLMGRTVGAVAGTWYVRKLPSDLDLHLTTPQNLAQMLVHGRVDVIIVSTLAAQDFEFEHYPLETPELSLELYHYLHKRHQDLLPEITAVLSRMKDEGAFAALLAGTFTSKDNN
ncbi:substrate-binding periplasmic protein [Candidatus Rhodobacter oscarellae]|uniref:substrate-binding periplasmic protein n=1 Tax=Candidatus Rhodobacter oscarellae TaxID=1675527 RepID=UPI0013649A84|nr:transporter substrate-binding domain-containing protein [Candidatus Rhodobacter lobularis]